MARSGFVVTILFSFAATAAGKATFEALDRNSDGKVSVQEASEDEALFVAFRDLDSDKNGELTREEFAKHKG